MKLEIANQHPLQPNSFFIKLKWATTFVFFILLKNTNTLLFLIPVGLAKNNKQAYTLSLGIERKGENAYDFIISFNCTSSRITINTSI